MSVDIRLFKPTDVEQIHQVHVRAFPEGENKLVAELVARLLRLETDPETIHLVALCNHELAGHAAFSPVTAEGSGEVLGHILAPLGVAPEQHGRGIGSQLVESGIDKLRADAATLLFVYGDPAYYGRFGFTAAAAAPYPPAYKLSYPTGWQALKLSEKQPAPRPTTLSCVEPLSNPALW